MIDERREEESPAPAQGPPHAPPVPVRVSIGSATSTGPDAAAQDLIRRADDKLYRAKHAGKNRTAAAGAETAVT